VRRWDEEEQFRDFCKAYDNELEDAQKSNSAGAYSFERFLKRAGFRMLLEHVVATKLCDSILGGFNNLDNVMQTKVLAKTNKSIHTEKEDENRLESLRKLYRIYLAIQGAFATAEVNAHGLVSSAECRFSCFPTPCTSLHAPPWFWFTVQVSISLSLYLSLPLSLSLSISPSFSISIYLSLSLPLYLSLPLSLSLSPPPSFSISPACPRNM
jgi:hypothetical protein